ncbi:MAG: uroporphyrinogen decarboxylase [Treponema sp.]|jgi:uroporphyrinogen decarboxylase|nr:uroporphyrinogen decarboxylase [Treponema sp.]
MTKTALLKRVFNNEKADRTPVGFWFHHVEDEMEDGFKNPTIFDLNIEGHKKFYTEFKPDFVKIMTDGFFVYPDEAFQKAEKATDLWNVRSIGEDCLWIEKQVAFAKTLADVWGDEVLSFYNIFAPAALFRFARGNQDGVEKTLADFIDEDEEAVGYAFNVVAKDTAALVRRIIHEGGVSGIYYSTQDINGRERSGQTRRRLVEVHDITVLNAANSVSQYNILHICGYAGHRNNLVHFADYPAQIVNWAVTVEGVSLGQGKKLFKNKPVIGGFDNTKNGVLYRGSREKIEAETERLLAESGVTGVILGADCTVPRDIDIRRLQWTRDKAHCKIKSPIPPVNF